MSWSSGAAFDRPSIATASAQTSPTASSPDGAGLARKRKRSSLVEGHGDDETSHSLRGSVSVTAGSPNVEKGKHQPGVKRACNNCRQQKLRCNVRAGSNDIVIEPCSRCVKHGLECMINNNFKRLGKRAEHEEMKRELEQCKAKLAQYEAMGIPLPDEVGTSALQRDAPAYSGPASSAAPLSQLAPFLGPSEAAASRSLLDLSQGYRELPPTAYPSITPGASPKTLRNVTLAEEQITDLYSIYFNGFHPFLPLLNPDWNYQAYYNLHPLLHWTIIAVAARRYDAKPGLLVEIHQPLEEMLWTTLSQVPQTYHVCKALALLCTWPLPNSSTSQEATMMLTGVMFQLALQYGLHRPGHAQDFSRFRIDLREEDIADRLNTWATVNVVAQIVATGQGQPPLARWAWYTYGLHLGRMKPELHTLCQIEKFCDTVTKTLFTMQRDHVVEVDPIMRGLQIEQYGRELFEMELTILSTRNSPIDTLYLKAAALHLRLAAFFDKPTTPNYLADLRNVYIAASSLLSVVQGLTDDIFLFLPRYVEQMILAGAVTLLKLLNSFYATHVDIPAGRTLFSKTVASLRRLSVRSNDLPQRLAEVMAQLWQSSGASQQKLFNGDEGLAKPAPDDSLQLRVRCRSSLSVLYDAIWRWRQQVGQEGRNNLDRAVQHPTTIPSDSGTARNTPQPPAKPDPTPMNLAVPTSTMIDDPDVNWDAFGESQVFDTLSWMLDGGQFNGFGVDVLSGLQT